ncbi:MAG: phosphocholine cytidylyltransferase family protein [Steroidobacteraceae bacterium]
MRAIILAAGRGQRLQQPEDQQVPKCLLRFGGKSLLERHLLALRDCGVAEVVLALGFKRELIEAELERMKVVPRTEIVINPAFELGSVLTVHTAAEPLGRGGDVLLMDADVLYHTRILQALVSGERAMNRVLMDREFEPGDEPVKLCLRGGAPVELRKRVPTDLEYDSIGESVGFFRFDETGARRLVELVAGYVARGATDMPHEEAVRDLIRERGRTFDVADVTGLPWIEIDFPNDVARAEREILPELEATGTTPSGSCPIV